MARQAAAASAQEQVAGTAVQRAAELMSRVLSNVDVATLATLEPAEAASNLPVPRLRRVAGQWQPLRSARYCIHFLHHCVGLWYGAVCWVLFCNMSARSLRQGLHHVVVNLLAIRRCPHRLCSRSQCPGCGCLRKPCAMWMPHQWRRNRFDLSSHHKMAVNSTLTCARRSLILHTSCACSCPSCLSTGTSDQY